MTTRAAILARVMGLDDAWMASALRDARMAPKTGATVNRAAMESEKARATKAFIAGALDEASWRSVCARVDGLLESGGAKVETLFRAVKQLSSWGELWDRMLLSERREALRIVCSRVVMDTRGHRVWLEPTAEYAGLFAHRAAGGAGIRPTGMEGQASTGLYLPSQLVGAA